MGHFFLKKKFSSFIILHLSISFSEGFFSFYKSFFFFSRLIYTLSHFRKLGFQVCCYIANVTGNLMSVYRLAMQYMATFFVLLQWNLYWYHRLSNFWIKNIVKRHLYFVITYNPWSPNWVKTKSWTVRKISLKWV